MKKYIVKLDIIAGGFEKGTVHLISADTREEAEAQAILNESHDTDKNELDESTGWTTDGCQEFAYRVSSTVEVSTADAKILAKYL